MQHPTVLVLGANGRFGRAAVDAFAAAGWRVLAQLRRPPTETLPAGAQALTTALADSAALAQAAAGASVVVHAVNPLYTRWDAELLPLFEQGVALARRLNALFMLPGNVYNFGEAMPPVLAEGAPQRPSTRKGEQRQQMELRMRLLAGDGLDSVLIRAGDFFGSGSGSWFDQAVVKSIANGKLVYPGPLDVQHAWAYLPDLAQAFVAVAARGTAPGFHEMHFAGHTLTGHELLAALDSAAADLGLRPAAGFRIGSMPWGVVRAIGLVHPLWRELARMSYLWRVPHALAGTALLKAAGPLPATPLKAALRQALIDLDLAPRASASHRTA